MSKYNSVLTIAGSDSGGCAGIQADIKSISANGAFAASVITATTAQNTQGVLDIFGLPIPHLEKQLEVVLTDIEFGAIKIGMLHSEEVINTVQRKLADYPQIPVVLDPVMVATSGHKLIDDNAIEALLNFLPKTKIITPNIPEAEVILGCNIDQSQLASYAQIIGKEHQVSVLLKGGHLEGEDIITDMLYILDENRTVVISHPKVDTKNTHGTGCSLSSAIAAHLSQGQDMETAVRKACQYVHEAILSGSNKILGKGHGPIDHFYILNDE